uniref:Transmembrane protein n=1 Tax=Medicago truncatula TaxID=3880 RepID=I3SJW1_MEDTR|nr:unknown [Medicago truncatula]
MRSVMRIGINSFPFLCFLISTININLYYVFFILMFLMLL